MRASARLFTRGTLAFLAAAVLAPAFAAPPIGGGTLRATFDQLPASSRGPSSVRFLGGNMESWVARWQILKDARRTIDTTTWMFGTDPFAMSYLGLLLSKAREGVTVRLMVDARGSSKLSKAFKGRDLLQELAAAGVDVRVYNPMLDILDDVLREHDRVLPLWASNHDKIIAVDGARVITGGRNIADYYSVDPADRHDVYRDADVLIDDPAVVATFKKAFDLEFDSDHVNRIRPDRVANVKPRDGDVLLAYHLMDTWLAAEPFGPETVEELRAAPAARDREAGRLLAQVQGLDPTPPAQASGDKHEPLPWLLARSLAGAPLLRGQGREPVTRAGFVADAEVRVLDRGSLVNEKAPDTINENLIDLVEAATDEIVIANAYLVLTDRALQVLTDAGWRGVKITILTNSPMGGSSIFTQAHFVENWPEILARVPNMRIFVFAEPHVKVHAKVAVIDRTVTALGSYNIDLVSAQVNGEILTASWSTGLASQCRDYITRMIDQGPPATLEYRIERDQAGNAVRDAEGRPIVAFGPADHCTAESLKKVAKYQRILGWLEKRLKELAPLM